MKQARILTVFGAVVLSWGWAAPSVAQEAPMPASPPSAAQIPLGVPSASATAAPHDAHTSESTTRRPAFWTNQPGLSFYYLKLARPNPDFVPDRWDRLCLAECDNSLLPGDYRLALGSGASNPVMAPGIFRVTKSSRFEGTYTDRSSTRLAGALVLGIGGVSGLSTLGLGITTSAMRYDHDAGVPFIVAGIVATVLSFAIGVPLAMTDDEAHVEQASD